MSRFVDLAAVERLDLGACQCEGTPHSSDWVEYQSRASYEDLILLGRAKNEEPLLLQRAIRAWNLVDDGQPVPVTPETIGRLDVLSSSLIYQTVSAAWLKAVGLPNASAAPSRDGSRGSGSHSRPKRTSTTS